MIKAIERKSNPTEEDIQSWNAVSSMVHIAITNYELMMNSPGNVFVKNQSGGALSDMGVAAYHKSIRDIKIMFQNNP